VSAVAESRSRKLPALNQERIVFAIAALLFLAFSVFVRGFLAADNILSLIQNVVVYVTEDRKVEGFFETMSIAENLYTGYLASGLENGPVVSLSGMRALALQWTKALNIRAIDSNARVIELSSGNQQKVVIAKALVQKPKLIIFDEPTRGVDVGAIAEIHQFINKLANEGLAVVVISSYLPEVMNLSDRILVSQRGRIVEEFRPGDATEERIMHAAVYCGARTLHASSGMGGKRV
jgi:simple sugar transport system ATP-binding protein